MSSIFTKIIQREIPGHIIAEDEHFIAILDINPLVAGHTLVIPKQEVDYIFDMGDDALGQYWKFAKKVAEGIKLSIPCLRVGVAVIGLEVPHAHIHLVPLNSMDDINFSNPKMNPNSEELSKVAEQIRSKLT